MAQTRLDRERIAMLTAALDTAYGPAADSTRVDIVRAPGRVNLIGDHMDYNEGFMLPVAIELDTWMAFRRRQDARGRAGSRNTSETVSFWIDALDSAHDPAGVERPSGRWSDYVAGTAWSLRE